MISKDLPQAHLLDIVGDVHGCYQELIELVEKLGYRKGTKDNLYRHPDGRHLVFVGDLTDKGPENASCLYFALQHHEAGVATYVMGNHCNKLGRWLKGNDVSLTSGLELTAAELETVSPEARKKLAERVLTLPIHASFDDGKLLVAHAAPPPKDASKGKTFSVCLYGYKTGRKTPAGFIERADWARKYEATAEPDDPFVVFGHVMYEEPYITEKSCGIDTACFKGNYLSAFRWPEKEVVQVKSRFKLPEDTSEIFSIPPETYEPPEEEAKPRPIITLRLDELLDNLRDNEEQILELIDKDPDLKKRDHDNGLVIANASPALFEPKFEHQLYAKGIVYTRDPYTLVSLPLVKMFNYGRREVSDQTTLDVLSDPDVTLSFPEKLDGTMIQAFAYEGEVYFTTRSVLEGTVRDDEDFDIDYNALARETMEKMGVRLESHANGMTFIYELIHPKTKVVTDYKGQEKLSLISVFDFEDFRYASSEQVRNYAKLMGVPAASMYDADKLLQERGEVLSDSPTIALDQKIKAVTEALDVSDETFEGTIVCLEKDGVVLHRVKAKTPSYLKHHRLKFHCTYRTVVELLWNKPELHDWDKFLGYLRDEGLTDEEAETFYQEHFEEFLGWVNEVKAQKKNAQDYLEEFKQKHPDLLDPEKRSEFFKTLALSFEERTGIFSLVMGLARGKGLSFVDAMRHYPAYDGFKGVVDQWKKDNPGEEVPE